MADSSAMADPVSSPDPNTIPEQSEGVKNRTVGKKSKKNKSKALTQNGKEDRVPVTVAEMCKKCTKAVFQMERVTAEKSIWHRNCFRCQECNKQLSVDTYASHEGVLYCKPHYKTLFQPKVMEGSATIELKKPELIIRENQPKELPPDVVRGSEKPNLGLEDLENINVRQRYIIFEQSVVASNDETKGRPSLKPSASILSKLAKFQAKGYQVGVSDDVLNTVNGEESSDDDEDEEANNSEDLDQQVKVLNKEKPFHFTGMSDVKKKWEKGEKNYKDEQREERKHELQTIRSRLFLGKQERMKEAYQQACLDIESNAANKKNGDGDQIAFDTKGLKEKFEKGQLVDSKSQKRTDENYEVYESEISRKSRFLFKQLEAEQMANDKKPVLKTVPMRTTSNANIKSQINGEVIKSASGTFETEDVVPTADIQKRFKFFEMYKEPEQIKKQFRFTPPKDVQLLVKKNLWNDEDDVEKVPLEKINDSTIAEERQTTTKMLSKFRQMEEDLRKPFTTNNQCEYKPLKRFTPPPPDTSNYNHNDESSGNEYDEESDTDDEDDLVQVKKVARAKEMRAKFEHWPEENMEVPKQICINDDGVQIDTTKSLRARFESIQSNGNRQLNKSQSKIKVNRFLVRKQQ